MGGLQLMTAESPGHESDKLRARSIDTAKSLWLVYFGVTITIALLLWATPNVGLYDAVAHGAFNRSYRRILNKEWFDRKFRFLHC